MTADNKSGCYKINIEFYVFADEGRYSAYCPSLDLATTGESFNEAVAAFYECFQLYIESCIEAGTLTDDLVAHGWRVTKSALHAPAFSRQLKNPEMKRLFNLGIGFEKIVAPAEIRIA